MICFNYRADRVRQVTRVLTRRSGLTNDPVGSQGLQLPKGTELDEAIPLHEVPAGLHYVCMTQYDKHFKLPVVIPAESMDNLAGEPDGAGESAESAGGGDGEIRACDLLLQWRD